VGGGETPAPTARAPRALPRAAGRRAAPGSPPGLDGRAPLQAEDWAKLRAKFNYVHGVTNVWSEPPMRGDERFKNGLKSAHLNQQPLKLIERAILASSDEGDAVWDPFAGLATTAVACLRTGRCCYTAEIVPSFFELARARLEAEPVGRWEDAAAGSHAG